MKYVGAPIVEEGPPDPDTLVGSVFGSQALGGTNPWTLPGALWHDGVTYHSLVTGTTGTLYLIAVKDDGTILTPVVIHANFQIDAHDSAAMLVLPNGKLMVMYCKHNSIPINVRVSSAVLDSTGVVAFGAAVNINSQVLSGGTYTDLQLHYLSSIDKLVLIFRKEPSAGTSSRWCISLCDPDLPTSGWAGNEIFWYMGGARKYVISWSNGVDRIDFCSMGNPGDIGHFYWIADDDIWYSSAGVDLGDVSPSVPLNESRVTTVYSTRDCYAFGVYYQADGKPLIVGGAYDGGDLDNFVWLWDGAAWQSHEIGDAGAGFAYNTGGVPQAYGAAVDDADSNRIFLIKDDAGGQAELFSLVTDDDWATFDETQITDGSSGFQFTPTPVRFRGDVVLAVWDYGSWTGYTSYNLGTKMVSVAP